MMESAQNTALLVAALIGLAAFGFLALSLLRRTGGPAGSWRKPPLGRTLARYAIGGLALLAALLLMADLFLDAHLHGKAGNLRALSWLGKGFFCLAAAAAGYGVWRALNRRR